MSTREKAKAFFLQMLPPSPRFQQTPIAFQQETLTWAGDWLWKQEATLQQLLHSNHTPELLKIALLEARLAVLEQNQTFLRELETKIKAFEQQKGSVKNVVGASAHIDAKGKVTVGDIGMSNTDGYHEKNRVDGKINAGGDVQIGDTVTTHHHYNVPSHEPTAVTIKTPKQQLQQLLAKEKTEEVIDNLLNILEKKDKDGYNTVLILSGSFHRIKKQVDRGIVKGSEADITLNKINDALTNVIDTI